MSLISLIKTDLVANRKHIKNKVILILYRLSNYTKNHNNFLIRFSGLPIRLLYKVFVMGFLSIRIPIHTKIGSGFNIGSGSPVVINGNSVIGNNVLIRQFVTLGNKGIGRGGCPVIGNNVEIGAGSVLIGHIFIGDNVIIGAGSVVTKSIPSNSTAYGNPVKIFDCHINEHEVI